jgi:hypothetical protein
MKYEKPNVTLVASAVEAVKTMIKDDQPLDNPSGLVSTSAYQSDE